MVRQEYNQSVIKVDSKTQQEETIPASGNTEKGTKVQSGTKSGAQSSESSK